MPQTLLGVVRADVVRMCEKGGRQVRCVKETAYEVDEAELQLYAEQLRANLEQAKKAELVLVWDDEYGGSTTEEDDRDVEQDPTMIESGDEREEGAGNGSSICTQDGMNRGDWGEGGGAGDREDDEEPAEDNEEAEDNE